jgi:hypothetical protein
MPSAQVWTGQEVRQLQRCSETLKLASGLVGRDDHLATLLIEDALEELRGLLGETAQPISRLAGDCH